MQVLLPQFLPLLVMLAASLMKVHKLSDHYQTLGVTREASSDEIKKAYRKLARELHPDVNPDPAVQDKFKEITAAYEVLSDSQKRQSYDMGGNAFGGGGFGGGFSDIMDAFFGGGGSRGPRPRMRAGQDSLIRVQVDLHEACFGTERELCALSAQAAVVLMVRSHQRVRCVEDAVKLSK
jgi:molecular chaperone DnaJ